MEKFDLLHVQVSVTNLHSACKKILQWISERAQKYVCVAPVSTIVDCEKDLKYRSAVNNAAMVTPDGMPVAWIGKLKGHKSLSRTKGAELMALLCEEGQAVGLKHLLYGSNDENLQKLEVKLREKYPQINIVEKIAPKFLAVGEFESQEVVDQINQANADILWIGIGSPKQDFWMANHREKLNVPVMVGVGAAFDFLSGLKPSAPRWMQNIGLEWFFRLCCEPKRLWKRYLVGNTLFIFFLIKSMFVRDNVTN